MSELWQKIQEGMRKKAIKLYNFYSFRKGVLKPGYECIFIIPSDTLPTYYGGGWETAAAPTQEPAYVLNKWQILRICEEYSKLKHKEDISKLVEIVESVATLALPDGLLVPVVEIELPEEEAKKLFDEVKAVMRGSEDETQNNS